MDPSHWIAIAISVTISVLLVTAVHWLLRNQLAKVWVLAEYLVKRCRLTAYGAAAVVGANLALPARGAVDWQTYQTIQHSMRILMIASLTALGITAAYAVTDMILARLSKENSDADRRSRRLQTQVRLLRRVVTSIIVVIAVSAILFTFPDVRALGAGLLASAGLIGIVAGVAAQSTLGNLFAGLQLAFSDSLRINDVVVVDGEWGRVEELSLVNVTIKIWDERRLVVPVANFTTQSFENWTKQATSLTVKVNLPLDWEVPVAELREEARVFISQHPLWDGRRWSLQVTDVLDSGQVMVRIVATAADSDAQWDLGCDIREHFVGYLVRHYPQSLPRRRTEFVGMREEEPYAAAFPSSAFRRSAAPSPARSGGNGRSNGDGEGHGPGREEGGAA